MLKMKSCCEKCDAATGLTALAYICSFECTFCAACTQAMEAVCPNCQGQLVARPTRTKAPAQALISQLKNKVFGA